MCGCHDTVTAAVRSECRESLNLIANRRGKANLRQFTVGETGDDRQCQHLEIRVLG